MMVTMSLAGIAKEYISLRTTSLRLCRKRSRSNRFIRRNALIQRQYVEEDDFVMGEQPEFPLLVKENGVHFAVYLNDGAMVGVFLDQRDVRRKIRDEYAKGKTVLNMFSYTGHSPCLPL